MNGYFASWGVARLETSGCIGVAGACTSDSEVFGSVVSCERKVGDGFSVSPGRNVLRMFEMLGRPG